MPIVFKNKPFVGSANLYRGFTLIELMITVTVAGILLTLAVPSMRTFIQNVRITNQTNDFIADLNFARSEAVKRAANVTICKSANPTDAAPSCSATGADWAIGRIIFIDSVVNGDYDPADEELLRIQEPLDGDNTLVVNDTSLGGSDARNLIVYNGSGGTTINPGLTATFKLCDVRGAAFGREISLGFRGKHTLVKPAASCN